MAWLKFTAKIKNKPHGPEFVQYCGEVPHGLDIECIRPGWDWNIFEHGVKLRRMYFREITTPNGLKGWNRYVYSPCDDDDEWLKVARQQWGAGSSVPLTSSRAFYAIVVKNKVLWEHVLFDDKNGVRRHLDLLARYDDPRDPDRLLEFACRYGWECEGKVVDVKTYWEDDVKQLSGYHVTIDTQEYVPQEGDNPEWLEPPTQFGTQSSTPAAQTIESDEERERRFWSYSATLATLERQRERERAAREAQALYRGSIPTAYLQAGSETIEDKKGLWMREHMILGEI